MGRGLLQSGRTSPSRPQLPLAQLALHYSRHSVSVHKIFLTLISQSNRFKMAFLFNESSLTVPLLMEHKEQGCLERNLWQRFFSTFRHQPAAVFGQNKTATLLFIFFSCCLFSFILCLCLLSCLILRDKDRQRPTRECPPSLPPAPAQIKTQTLPQETLKRGRQGAGVKKAKEEWQGLVWEKTAKEGK